MDVTQLTGTLFLDIETVRSHADFSQLTDRFRAHWQHKSSYLSEDAPQFSFQEQAGIYAEFGKIIVIGIGWFTNRAGDLRFRTRAISGHDEKAILEEFLEFLQAPAQRGVRRFCAHNGKEFDFPWICRRLLIHGLPLPPLLRISGKKPWETPQLIDTLELWKFGDRKAYTSLDLLAACLGLPGSKGDLQGSEVGKVYYETGDLKRIATYCQKDVAVLAQVYLRLLGEPALKPEKILIQG